jgi:hypothetical protein
MGRIILKWISGKGTEDADWIHLAGIEIDVGLL